MSRPVPEEFMTLWDYVPDPGLMTRDPRWRETAMREFTKAAANARRASASLPSDRLTALVDDAGLGRRAKRDVARVEAAIAAALPDGVCSFATEILSVRKGPDGLVARVRLFDGGLLVLTMSVAGEPAIHAADPEGDRRDFGYRDGVWRRVDEPATPPPAEDQAPRRPSPEDVAYVEAAIRGALPKGVPSYAKEVLSVLKIGPRERVVRLRLFDDEIGVLHLSGQPGAHGYGWEEGERDPRPFHWDEDAMAWVRIEEPDG